MSGQPRTAVRQPTAEQPVRRRARVVPVVVLLAMVGIAGVWLVGFTGVLGVRTVTVTGLRSLPESDIRAAAAVRDGQPLARVDTGAVAARVRALPGVERVAVTRSWPSTLRIAITERHGVAVAAYDGQWWLVDPTGLRFQLLAVPPPGTPRLSVADPAPGDPATAAALAALAALTPPVRAEVQVAAAKTPDSVTLTLTGKRTVLWGGAADGAAKARVLPVLLARPGTVYDVSTPSVVTVR
jgi:cell division protein FtsQ